MNKILSFQKIGMIIRWDCLTYAKRYIGITLGLSIAAILYYLLQLHSLQSTINHGGEEFFHEFFLHKMAGFTFFLVTMAFFVMAANIFANMKTRLQCERFLMLPANNIEKFIARALLVSVGSVLLAIVACIIADMIQLLFSFFLTPHHHESVILGCHELIARVNYSDHLVSAIVFKSNFRTISAAWTVIILCHSFCILGGSLFRKHPVLMTFFAGIIILFFIGYSVYELAEWGFFDIFPNIADSYKDTITTLLWFVGGLGIATFNYWASYKIFTRMQVISNKWINI